MGNFPAFYAYVPLDSLIKDQFQSIIMIMTIVVMIIIMIRY